VKVAYLDCFAGIAGDMCLGALVDLGVELPRIEAAVRGLGVGGFSLTERRVYRGAIGGVKVDVRLEAPQPERHLSEIEAILDGGPLPETVRESARRVFRRLTEAEARVHRMPVERVHLHEVGALDAIVDVVGTCFGLHALGVERVVASPIVTGRGITRGEHGPIPVPGPATLELLRGVPVRGGEVEAEMTTPTGAALAATLAESFGPMPDCRPLRVGYGAGTRELDAIPNLLRVVLGEAELSAGKPRHTAIRIEANLDDLSPQVFGYVSARLFEEGALDVWTTAAVMKKGRPGHVLAVLAPPERAEALIALVFQETTTIGLRLDQVERRVLDRRFEEVATPYGPVRLKVASLDGKVKNTIPEYEDCAELARKTGAPLKEVQAAALEAWRARSKR